jgi:4-amino-4-deoxy-L-arabinose transferase-like glycosyltransferase
LAIAALALLVGAWLRIHPIATRPLWYDEAFTWYVAEDGAYREWLRWHSREPKHPPLSFAAVAVSMKVLGSEAEWAVRVPGVVAGVVVIPAMFVLGSTIAGSSAGALAASLAAVAPNMVDQGQQARMFSMLALFEIVALAAVVALLERARTGRRDTIAWIATGAVLAAAFWTNQLAIAVWAGVAAGALAWAVRAKNESPGLIGTVLSRLVLMFGAACVLSAPGILSIAEQTFGGAHAEETTGMGAFMIAREIWQRALELAGGPVGAALLYPLAFFGLYHEWRRGRASAFILGAVGILAVAILFPLRQRQPFLVVRYLSAAEPVLLAAAAVGVAATRGRVRVAAAVAFVMLCGLALRDVLDAERYFIPRRTAVAYATLCLREHLRDGDEVVFHSEFHRLVGNYYGLPRNSPLHTALYKDPALTHPQVLDGIARPARLWMIAEPAHGGPGDPSVKEQRAEVRAFARWYGHAARGDAIAGHLPIGRQRALVLRFGPEGIVRLRDRPGKHSCGRFT